MAVIKKEKNKQFEKTKMIVSRVIAVFAASGLSVVGAGSIVGIELTQAITLAGALGVCVPSLSLGWVGWSWFHKFLLSG